MRHPFLTVLFGFLAETQKRIWIHIFVIQSFRFTSIGQIYCHESGDFSGFLDLRAGPSTSDFAFNSSSLARSAGVRILKVKELKEENTFVVASFDALGSDFGGGGCLGSSSSESDISILCSSSLETSIHPPLPSLSSSSSLPTSQFFHSTDKPCSDAILLYHLHLHLHPLLLLR